MGKCKGPKSQIHSHSKIAAIYEVLLLIIRDSPAKKRDPQLRPFALMLEIAEEYLRKKA